LSALRDEVLLICNFLEITQTSLYRSPLNAPYGNIVFFDGYCHLCHGSVKILIRFDKKHILRYAPLQGETAKSLLRAGDVVLPDSMIYLRKGNTHFKSSAVLWLLSDLAWYFKWVLLFLIIPAFIRNALYDFIAKNRYRWFGKYDSCELPRKDLSHLFLS
jgi:predicted DCC family thiol-disulfide oxidoreductase YuxK